MENILHVLLAQTDWAVLVLRIALGVIFMAHGWNKIKDYRGTAQWFDKWNFKPAGAWTMMAIVTQFGGGLCILLGVFVQAASLILVFEMIIATMFNIKRKSAFFKVLELDIVLLAALLLLATLGNGFLAIGNLF